VSDLSRLRRRSSAYLVSSVLIVLLTSCTTPSRESSSAPSLEARLQRAVDRFLITHRVPGASVAVIVGGKSIAVVGGVADLHQDRRVTPNTVFPIASIAKTYTAALMMQLVEAGAVGLHDPVDRWLPNLPPHLREARTATVEQLLSHTSGLPQTFTRDEDRGHTLGPGDLLERIPPPECSPGRCYVYGDGNYILAALVIEAATGRPWSAELNRRILHPLGLSHTFPSGSEPPAAATAVQYRLEVDENGEPKDPPTFLENVLPRWTLGSIRTTASDLAAWGDALFAGRVLRPATLERMMDPGVSKGLPCPQGCGFPYGLGVVHYTVEGRPLVGHDGSSGAVLAYDPARKVTIAIVTNGGQQNIGAFLKAIVTALG
jgi:D-alanyl-D-alanine carboxypeptidase